MPHHPISAIQLTQDLIRCPSVTPQEAGTLDLLQNILESFGFVCHRRVFTEIQTDPVDNLYARWGQSGPNICFAGHTDVVPAGDLSQWTFPPFEGIIDGRRLYGRGAVDMKGAIACFVAAAADWITQNNSTTAHGSISFLITCDEEGPAINGTQKMLEWLKNKGEAIDLCVVGEPTNPKILGEMIKNGRRGSLGIHLTVHGIQGHIAYPHLADNPCHKLIFMLHPLLCEPIDQGMLNFSPSTLQISSIDVGNPTGNMIPSRAEAKLNIRFNPLHTRQSLEHHIRQIMDQWAQQYQIHYDVKFSGTGEAFYTDHPVLAQTLSTAVKTITGRTPELSTSGGTSDARFIKDHCPVIEFGLVGETAHKVNEFTTLDDLDHLTAIYKSFIDLSLS